MLDLCFSPLLKPLHVSTRISTTLYLAERLHKSRFIIRKTTKEQFYEAKIIMNIPPPIFFGIHAPPELDIRQFPFQPLLWLVSALPFFLIVKIKSIILAIEQANRGQTLDKFKSYGG